MDPQHTAVARAAQEIRTVRHFQRFDVEEQDAYLRDLGALAAELALLLREAGVTWEAMSEEPRGEVERKLYELMPGQPHRHCADATDPTTARRSVMP